MRYKLLFVYLDIAKRDIPTRFIFHNQSLATFHFIQILNASDNQIGHSVQIFNQPKPIKMKKNVIIFMMMVFTIVMYSQKEKNGTIYKEHPAINAVENMLQAFFVEGDSTKAGSYLAPDFRSFSGTTTNKDAKGRDRSNFLRGVAWFKKNIDYVSIERSPGAYPDALDYKDDNDEDDAGLWVQTWNQFSGVHKVTGVKLDMPIHRLFKLNKDNKIRLMFTYDNDRPWIENGQSFVERENGTIYNHHEYINKVRRMVHAFENDDMEVAYSFYADNARFRNIHMKAGESMTLEESKANDKKFKENFELTSIDVRGYPDYLNYGIRNSKVVMSWWNVRLTRKADDKKLVVPVMFIHDFNDEGMVTSEMAYYSLKMLED